MLTFVELTSVNSRLASVEGAIVGRIALASGEIDSPASKLSKTTSIEAWEASRARYIGFRTDSGMGIVERAEFEQFLEELPAADEVAYDYSDTGFSDVPELVGRGFRGSEVVVSGLELVQYLGDKGKIICRSLERVTLDLKREEGIKAKAYVLAWEE
jgi:hypothetical protein